MPRSACPAIWSSISVPKNSFLLCFTLVFQISPVVFHQILSSCLITCVLESLSSKSPFFSNANVNSLQRPLIRPFFLSQPDKNTLKTTWKGYRHFCHASLLPYVAPTWRNDALELYRWGLFPSVLKTFWSFSIFYYGFKIPGGVNIIHVPHPTVTLEGANIELSVLMEWFILPQILREDKHCKCQTKSQVRDFPGGAVVKNPLANAGDTGSIPGPGRSHMPWSN